MVVISGEVFRALGYSIGVLGLLLPLRTRARPRTSGLRHVMKGPPRIPWMNTTSISGSSAGPPMLLLLLLLLLLLPPAPGADAWLGCSAPSLPTSYAMGMPAPAAAAESKAATDLVVVASCIAEGSCRNGSRPTRPLGLNQDVLGGSSGGGSCCCCCCCRCWCCWWWWPRCACG